MKSEKLNKAKREKEKEKGLKGEAMGSAPHGYILVKVEIQAEDGQFTAYCPELGTASCGDTFEEAAENIKEALCVHLNTLEELGERRNFFKEHNIHLYRKEPTQEAKKRLISIRPGVYTTMQALPA